MADIVSCGFDLHEFWALAPGGPADWLRFGESLESALIAIGFPSHSVHDEK